MPKPFKYLLKQLVILIENYLFCSSYSAEIGVESVEAESGALDINDFPDVPFALSVELSKVSTEIAALMTLLEVSTFSSWAKTKIQQEIFKYKNVRYQRQKTRTRCVCKPRITIIMTAVGNLAVSNCLN